MAGNLFCEILLERLHIGHPWRVKVKRGYFTENRRSDTQPILVWLAEMSPVGMVHICEMCVELCPRTEGPALPVSACWVHLSESTEVPVFIAKLPTPPAGAVSQRVRFFKDGEFSHMHVLGLDETFEVGSPELTATVDYGDETGEQVGEVIALTFADAEPE